MSRIAATIAEMYPHEPDPAAIAETLQATAQAHDIDEHLVVLWLYDRPRHELSAAHLTAWVQKLRP